MRTRWLLFVCFVLLACGGPSEICDQAGDEDADGLFDCQDDDCQAAENCQVAPEICDNDIDDNGNTAIDCQELSCANNPHCIPETDCSDAADNDTDDLTDCADPDCNGNLDCIEPICNDGIDNEGDGITDCDDTDCIQSPVCLPETTCTGGVDDDQDGLTDCADPDCAQICNDLFCGNGTLEPNEECDDGNQLNGDCCSSDCILEGCQSEIEPNNSSNTATGPISSPANITASISPAGDTDFFAIQLPVTGGLRLEVTGPGGVGSCGFDSFLTLFSTNGTTQLISDDDDGVDNCSLINPVSDNAANNLAPGTYFAKVNEFGDNGTANYRLVITALACGDGIVVAPESCDDGNNVGGDGCSPTCTNEPICGDGILIFPVEQCDDGNTNANDGCSPTCQIEVICGDGTVLAPEICDGAQLQNQTCVGLGFASGTLACAPTCDAFDTTGCVPSVCGNNIIETGESCDDGNTLAGDGCSDLCTFEISTEIESNNSASLANTITNTQGLIQGAITPATDEDFFALTLTSTADLKIETFDANGPTTCVGIDTLVQLRKPDGTSVLISDDNDGTNNCSLINPAVTADAAARGLLPGTYFVRVIESGQNAVINGYRLKLTLAASCGNGLLEGSERCDDGNLTPGDGCEPTCQSCGDGVVATGEECEPPSSATCDATCQRVPVCGDGFVDQGEQCDDSNQVNGDCCSSTCQVESTCEAEPNNTAATASGPFVPPTILQGGIVPVADADFYALTLPNFADLQLETSGTAGIASCAFDTVLQLIAPDGSTVLISDDNDGTNNCSKIDSNVAADAAAKRLAPGTYFLRVNENGDNAQITKYLLHVSFDAICGNNITEGSEQCDGGIGCSSTCEILAVCGDGVVNQTIEQCDDGNSTLGDGCDDLCLYEESIELEPNNSIAEAQASGIVFTTSQLIQGDLGVNDRDFYALTLTSTTHVVFETFDGAFESCVGVDTVIEVFSETGVKLFAADDGGIGSCSRIDTSLPAGTYYIRVHDFDFDDPIALYSLLIDLLP